MILIHARLPERVDDRKIRLERIQRRDGFLYVVDSSVAECLFFIEKMQLTSYVRPAIVNGLKEIERNCRCGFDER